MSLRPLRDDDADAVAALVRRAFAAQSMPTDPPASALRLTGQDVRAHLAAGGGGAVGAVAGSLAASVMWSVKDGGLYVARLAIDPAWRRRGLARALLRAAESAATAQGLPRMHLGTRLVLADNRALFESCGFVEVARHAHPGYAEPTWAEFEKSIAMPVF